MRKLAVLAFKEVMVAFRDVGALVTMLATPLALTLVMMAAFGSGDSTPISDIPVLLLNKDTGVFGQTLTDVFFSVSVGDLVTPTLVEDEATTVAAARARVDADEVAALVIIPEDFSARVFPFGTRAQELTGMDVTKLAPDATLTPEQQAGLAQAFVESQAPVDPVIVEIYASPDRRISTLIVKAIVSQSLERLNIQIAGTTNIVTRLMAGMIQAGQTDMDVAAAMGATNPETAGQEASAADLPIKLNITSATGRGFSWLGYYASSMAVLFLMFAVTSGGRTLLAERQRGTLPRLLITPTTPLTVLLGKMGGIVLTGVLQMLILWGATTLIGAYWGHPGGVLLTIVLLVTCASSVGALISAWARTPGQASAIGSAITLIGGALSGSFFVRWNLPQWVQYVSLVTPNAWGIEILSRLQAGRDPVVILPWLGGMLLLTIVYYGLALLGFRRQFK
ncbi:MAG: ABC transporter permease [Anaerolineae bacterium]|nr:ABC transporter permease [Anaerolineae bacterium]